jgi:hypothetical protein
MLPPPAPFLDRHHAEPPRLPQRVFDHGAACAGSSRDGIYMQGADAMQAHLVRDDPERGHLGLG